MRTLTESEAEPFCIQTASCEPGDHTLSWPCVLAPTEPNDGPGPDGHHVITGECFACIVGVATGPESHGERCPMGRGAQS